MDGRATPIAADPDGMIADAVPGDLAMTGLHHAYRELAGMVLGREPLSGTLSRIASLVQDLVEGADDVSVTMIRSKTRRTVAFAGDSRLAFALDERQYQDGRGPCLDAAVTGETIAIDDTASSQLYPEFAAMASEHGVGHTLAVGFPTIHDVSGALNIYGRRGGGGFCLEARQVAQAFSHYAAVAVTNAALYAHALSEAEQLTEAMKSRATIEQAKGMIMQSKRCGPDDAFVDLRKASMDSNRKLYDIALSLVTQFPDRKTQTSRPD